MSRCLLSLTLCVPLFVGLDLGLRPAADRCEVSERSKVQDIQEKIEEALIYSFRKNHRGETQMFARLVAAITELRNVTDQYRRYCEQLKIFSNNGAVNMSPLFFEIISLT